MNQVDHTSIPITHTQNGRRNIPQHTRRDPTPTVPIHGLPEELLLSIIRYSITPEAPLNELTRLSSVCHHWKMVLEGAPTLWRTIDLSEGLSLVRRAGRLSQNVLLDIKHSFTSARSSTGVTASQVLDEMRDSITRTRSLRLRLLGTDLASTLEILKTASAPRLNDLLLESTGSWNRASMEKAAPLFGGSGGFLLLEHLNLSGFPISLASLKVSCLKSLSLKRIALVSDDDILQLLACSTGLESLSLDWPDNSGWPNVTREPPTVPFINLPSLRDFKLTQSPPPFARLLLSAILVPVLQTFEIGGGHYTHPVTDILNPHLPHLANTLSSMINDVEIVAVEINRTQCVVQAGQVTIRTVHPKNNESLTRTINPALKWLQGLGGRIGQVPLHVYVAEDYGGLDGDIWD